MQLHVEIYLIGVPSDEDAMVVNQILLYYRGRGGEGAVRVRHVLLLG